MTASHDHTVYQFNPFQNFLSTLAAMLIGIPLSVAISIAIVRSQTPVPVQAAAQPTLQMAPVSSPVPAQTVTPSCTPPPQEESHTPSHGAVLGTSITKTPAPKPYKPAPHKVVNTTHITNIDNSVHKITDNSTHLTKNVTIKDSFNKDSYNTNEQTNVNIVTVDIDITKKTTNINSGNTLIIKDSGNSLTPPNHHNKMAAEEAPLTQQTPSDSSSETSAKQPEESLSEA